MILKALELDKIGFKIEPLPDIAICSKCNWRGPVSECIIVQDEDWKTGHFDAHDCPKCEDGGCIDDYDMSIKRAIKWNYWNIKRRSIAV